ncbi:MAG TPA: glycosyltransferase family 1 protein [Ilumatobacteraceae bacterium]|nr:glycosyltransferase family 1 protein [Ilumatobacteraceae bacterium]
MPDPVRVAYTIEQCWHDVPGGTAVAALRIGERLDRDPSVELVAVAGRHRRLPPDPWRPPFPVAALPLARPWLYESWLRFRWPPVERATGPVDVCHATALVPAPTRAPLVVTVHDLAFLRAPDSFTRHGVRVMRRSIERIARHADIVVCPSQATMADVEAAGVGTDRLRLVPLGVDATVASPEEVGRVRTRHDLPSRFVLFVGTVEPRKNLERLAQAVARLDEPLPLVIVGADGWGGVADTVGAASIDTRFLGFVADGELAGLYAAASVFAYPSVWEGFGLPVAEAMAQGTPVVTSRGTSTAEVAGGAAVLVDPLDVDDIARGLTAALGDRDRLHVAGRARAAELTWEAATAATRAVYAEVRR